MTTVLASPPEHLNAGYRAGAWLRSRESQLFMLVIALQLIPIWSFKFLPTTDGPAHVANAAILRDYKRPDATAYQKYYLIRKAPDPNLAGHLAMVVLMSVASPLGAEKILVSLYIVLLPIAFRYAVAGIRRDAGALGFLILPFTLSYVFHMGFYNFCLSIAGYFFVVGYWLRNRESFAMRQTVIFTILMLALYCCHFFSLAMAGLTIGALGIWMLAWDWGRALIARRQPDGAALWLATKSRLLLPFYSALPAVLLALAFVAQNPEMRAQAQSPSKRQLVLDLITLDGAMVSFRSSEVYLTATLALLLVLGALAAIALKAWRRELSWSDGLVLVIPGILYIYMTRSGGVYYVMQRASLFAFLVLAFWLATQTWPTLMKRILQVGAAAIAVALVGLHIPKYAAISGQMKEFVSAEQHIAANSTVLPLVFAGNGWRPADGAQHSGVLSEGVVPFLFADGYLTYKKRIVSFRNYEASTRYFPVVYKPELNPYVHVETQRYGIESVPPHVDFASYPARTGGSVDYVMLWGRLDEMKARDGVPMLQKAADAAAIKSMFMQLETQYDLVYTSQPNELVHLYKRKP